MKELYWFTRLDYLSTTFCAASVILGILSVFALIGVFVTKLDNVFNEGDRYTVFWNRLSWISLPSFMVSLMLFIFTPSTKDAYLIYGVGGAMDFLKTDNVASQIPHKTVEALDAWLEHVIPDYQTTNKPSDNNGKDNKQEEYDFE